MSSTVTMPAVPPYSSMTTAKVMRRACISRSRSGIRLVSGTRWAGSGQRACTGASGSPSKARRSRTSTTPCDVVEVLAVDGDAAVLALAHEPPQRRPRAAAGRDRHDVGARGHHLAHERLARSGRGRRRGAPRPPPAPAAAGPRAPTSRRSPRPPPGSRAARRRSGAIDRRGGPRAQRSKAGSSRRNDPLGVTAARGRRAGSRGRAAGRPSSAEGRQHRPVVDRSRKQRGDDHGHAHVGGVGAEVDRHQQARRVVEVALGQLDARLVVEADLGEAAPLEQVEGRLDRGQEDGQRASEDSERGRPGAGSRAPEQPPPQPPLQAVHRAVVGLVVVAEHVQEAVEREHVELLRQRARRGRRAFRAAVSTLITTSPRPASPPSPGNESTSVGRSLPRYSRLRRRRSRSPARTSDDLAPHAQGARRRRAAPGAGGRRRRAAGAAGSGARPRARRPWRLPAQRPGALSPPQRS